MEDIKTNKQGAIDYFVDCIATICEGYKAKELDVDGVEFEDLSTMIEQLQELEDDTRITIFDCPMSASGLNFRVEN